MAKKRRTKAQKVRAAQRPTAVTPRKVVSHVAAPKKAEAAIVNYNQHDLVRSLSIVGILIGAQLLLWLIFHLTHIDNSIYNHITL